MLSIIIPLYNREELIKNSLDSVLMQTNPHWECLVVDDGSTDNSCDVVEEYAKNDPRIILLRRTEDRPKGPSACRNIGCEHAKGEYVYYLDSDDILEPHFCENISEQFEDNPGIDFIAVHVALFRGSIHDLEWLPPAPVPDIPVLDYFLFHSFKASTQTFCWRKTLLDKFPRHWPEDMRRGVDRVCYYRILTKQPKGMWWKKRIQLYLRIPKTTLFASPNDRISNQKDSFYLSQHFVVATRVFEAYRTNGLLNNKSLTLYLNYCLNRERNILLHRQFQAAKSFYREILSVSTEFHMSSKYGWMAYLYMKVWWLFPFHKLAQRLFSVIKTSVCSFMKTSKTLKN